MSETFFNDIDFDLNHFNQFNNNFNNNFGNEYFNSDSFNNYIINENLQLNNFENLSLIHLNIRSIKANGDNFISYLETINLKFDLICLSETWINDDDFLEDFLPGYKGFHSIRSGSRGGGVSIFVNEKFDSSMIDNLTINSEFIECIFVKIFYNRKNLVVGTCYRPPGSNYEIFQSEICQRLSTLNVSLNYSCILCGDFNIDMMKIETNSNVNFFYDSMSSLSYIPTICKPTRITDETVSIIDNIFVTNLSFFKSSIFEFDVSDHFPIFIIYKNVFTSNELSEKISYRVINDSSLSNLKFNLITASYEEIIHGNDVNNSIIELDRIILSEFNKTCPIKTKTITQKDRKKPWITIDLKLLIKKRQNYFNLFRQRKMSKPVYNRFKNFVTKRLVLAKKFFYSNLLNNIKGDIKKTWNIINNILNPNKSNNKTSLKRVFFNNQYLETDFDIANAFNSHFSSVGRNINLSFPSTAGSQSPSGLSTTVDSTDGVGELSNIGGTINSMFFSPVSSDIISKIILSLKNKSSNILSYSTKILKYLVNIVSPLLCSIINKSLLFGQFPEIFKSAKVVPIHKGGSVEDVNNYRPISVLPLLSKIFERVVFNQLNNFFAMNNLFHSSQYGFRKNKSTIQAIINNLDYIYKKLDTGKTVLSIFLDFKKAFDCVDHNILLSKLNKYGVRGVPHQWLSSYLSNRTQFVSINGVTSSTLPISYGVPQGSILGPLLFIIFINDFPMSSDLFKFVLFADDSTLTCSFDETDGEVVARTVSDELTKIDAWLLINKISLNYDKTKFIIFSYRKNFSIPNLKFGNYFIFNTNKIKFLGLLIDKNLKFENHVDLINSKIARGNGIIYKLNKYLPQDILRTLYFTLIHPHITYGIEVWYGSSDSIKNKVQVLQKKSVRAMSSLPFNSHTHQYFKDNFILKLEDLFRWQLSTRIFKSLQDPINDGFMLDTHYSHSTRYGDRFVLPRFNLTKTQSSFVYRKLLIWNEIPSEIKSIENHKKFKSTLKNYLISNY